MFFLVCDYAATKDDTLIEETPDVPWMNFIALSESLAGRHDGLALFDCTFL